MTLLEAHIEEFEQGTWVADLIADQTFGPQGTFQLPDGSTWVGSRLSEVQDRNRYFTKVVGGNAALGAVVLDQFYQGQVSLRAMVSAMCAAGPTPGDLGETPADVPSSVFLEQYQRFLGTRAEALDAVAKAAGGAVSPGSEPLLWWIGRDGLLRMQIADPTTGARVYAGSPITGTQNMDKVDVDASAELVTPAGVQLGALYNTKPVRHVRWKYTPSSFGARVFFVPFIFRPPTQTKYDRSYNAKIVSDHGDGTVDVIAYRSPSEGKSPAFGINAVQLFCGVPGSKVTMHPGEEVTLAFFGGDPQKPFCMSMKQDATVLPTKQVARNGDLVQLDIGATIVGTIAGPAPGPILTGPVTITLTAPAAPGKIIQGSSRLLVGDA